ncbi:MAG: hypothetical protein KatS3mg004_1387 [Bryobacteraceae bacterium]|nr:MAG: hypothetical protein KatS3mg004_1387 [Bryobacteraceae bacterium]
MIETSFEMLPDLETGAGPRARADTTRTRILDAAERLFAERGFAGASLRDITAEAHVNLAAVNYHFGSKDELFLQVVLRRLEPVNRRRLELLEEAEQRPGGARLEDVARAFVRPVIEVRHAEGESGALSKLMARVVGEPGGWAEKLLPVAFAGVAARFLAAIERAMPGARREDLVWGLVFSAGVLSYYLLLTDVIPQVVGGQPGLKETGETVERMVAYIVAGLRGLADPSRGEKRKKAGGGKRKKKGKQA